MKERRQRQNQEISPNESILVSKAYNVTTLICKGVKGRVVYKCGSRFEIEVVWSLIAKSDSSKITTNEQDALYNNSDSKFVIKPVL